MTATRNAALSALFVLVSSAFPWKNAPSRRLKLWVDVPAAERPALFQFEGGKATYVWKNDQLVKRTVEVKLFIYVNSSDKNPGAPQLAAILDAIDAAMAPAGADLATNLNSLGGTCYYANIKDVPDIVPGDIDGSGLMVVQIEIVLP